MHLPINKTFPFQTEFFLIFFSIFLFLQVLSLSAEELYIEIAQEKKRERSFFSVIDLLTFKARRKVKSSELSLKLS